MACALLTMVPVSAGVASSSPRPSSTGGPASTGKDCDVVVVGAGIVGLATADAIQQRMPGLEVVVLDKESGPAQHQTGRNSGVVHSGLYYTPGSAKARLVAEGRRLLRERCEEWGVTIDWCGKVVVATHLAQLAPLDELERRGAANGVEVHRIGPPQLHDIEPHVSGLAALHVPSAGIVDYGQVAAALASQLVERGGTVQTDSQVTAISALPSDGGVQVTVGGSTPRTITARWLVNCAGLHSDRVARLAGCDTQVTIVPFRGEYHELTEATRYLCRNLIYPVPDPRWPFLGVHMTRMMDRSVHVGPNAVLSFGREAYEGGMDVADTRALLRDPGLRRLARRYWKTGATELVRSRSSRLLLRDVRELLPEVQPQDLVPSSSGIRAQAMAPDGSLLDDFAFASSHRAVHVLNAPSPAATASLAIGGVVTDRLVEVMESTV